MTKLTPCQRGFSLVELLVSTGIALTITAAIMAAARPTESVFVAQSEAADEQQRGRVATSVLFRDLVAAGAGPDAGPDAGPLGRSFAPILPWHLARDGPGIFRDDALTLAYVPSSQAQTTIAGAMSAQSGSVRVNIGAGCPLNDAACGFSGVTTVLVYDETGSVDVFRVEDVQGSLLELRHTTPDSEKTYRAGSRIVSAIVRSYFLKADEATDTFQLMRDEGNGGPEVPVVDHIVRLRFEYFGEPSNGSAALLPAVLTDGPWRPDEAAPNRYDVDLLRIRTIAVDLRVESAMAALRGPAGALFSRAGTSKSGSRFLPDQNIRFRVSPRNMGVR